MKRWLLPFCALALLVAITVGVVGCSGSSTTPAEKMGGKMDGKMDDKIGGKMDGKMDGKMGDKM
jgi:hypothetical protein